MNDDKTTPQPGIVAGGANRIIRDEAERLKHRYAARCAQRLARAGLIQRWLIRRRIDRWVRRRLARSSSDLAPRGALYAISR
ncbi:MAG: hypothetical protein IID36_01480 [Planctomycetes bacterium]|nr:hypothetical protein [Planctomycetota bacterium]